MSDETFFDERGIEKYRNGLTAVWPRRSAERRQQEHGKYIALLLERLAKLEKETRPSGGDATANSKDLKAFDALQLAGHLVEAVAGWALDHQVGLADEGLEFVPLQPPQTKNHLDYLASRKSVDRHDHEKHGGQLAYQRPNPEKARRLLANLLVANPGGFPLGLKDMTVNALRGLDYGEEHLMFARRKTGRKRDLTTLRIHLRAIGMIAYRRQMGMTKANAINEVAENLGVHFETVKGWEGRLCAQFGALEVGRTMAFARNHAMSEREHRRRKRLGDPMAKPGFHAERYDDEALTELSEEYKASLKA